jgi:hypothetical protein
MWCTDSIRGNRFTMPQNPISHQQHPWRDRMQGIEKGYPNNIPNAQKTWMILWALAWVPMYSYFLGVLTPGSVGTLIISYADILMPGVVIFYVYGLGRNSKIMSSRFIFWFLAIFLYGSTLGLVNNGITIYWRYDATVFVAFFAGIALIEVLPKKLPLITITIVVCLWVSMIATVVGLNNAENIELLEEGVRITSYESFVASYAVICLTAPAWILVRITSGPVLRALVQLSVIAITGLATFVLQTYSYLISMIIAILLAIMGTHCVARTEKINKKVTSYTWAILSVTIIICAIVIRLLMPIIELQWNSIIGRSQGFSSSVSVDNRIKETKEAIGAMSNFEHITGRGYGGIVAYTNVDDSRNLHLAIFNVWTRFGIVVFIFIMLYVLRNVFYYFYLCLVKPIRKFVSGQSTDIGILVYTSGLLSLATIASISGGWSPIVGLCLGILFGLRGSISNGLIQPSDY